MQFVGSTAGHIGAAKILQDAGLQADRDYQIAIVGEGGRRALLDGAIDAWADSNVRIGEAMQQAKNNSQEIAQLARGDSLPGEVLVANPVLGQDFIAALHDTILEVQDDLMAALSNSPGKDKYWQSGWIAVDDNHYNEIRAMYFTLGLESMIH